VLDTAIDATMVDVASSSVATVVAGGVTTVVTGV